MTKTQEELNQLKNKYESLTNKLKELTNEELIQVTGGTNVQSVIEDNPNITIRGASSINQDSQPLYVVDGL